MSPAFGRSSFPVVILSLAWLGIVQAGTAQLGNSVQIERDFKGAKGKLTDLMNGKDKVFPLDLLDAAAKYWVYRVTWPSVLDVKADTGSDPVVLHVEQFKAHIKQVLLVKGTEHSPFVDAYSPVLVTRFKELTDLPVVENSRAIIHGMQMLPTLAKLQHESIGKYLAELLDPKTGKHDIIKLGALKALREFLPVDSWGDPTDTTLFKNPAKMARKEADLQRVDLLTQFILRPPPAMAKPEELDAYRYLRREAIETLGQAGAPAVAAIKTKGVAEGPVAEILLRVLIPGAITPETNLAEQNEAALGLCNMKPLDKYEAGSTYYFINKTLFDLCRDYSEDAGNIAAADKRQLVKFPWKVTSKRWDAALKQLVANAPTAEKKKTAEAIKAKADPVLKKMFDLQPLNANDVIPDMRMAPTTAEFTLFQTIKSTPLKWDGAK